MPTPDPNVIFPVPGENGQDPFDVTYIKPTITRPNIIVGDFTYFSGSDFESRVTHHYEFYGDKLMIGKFCQIAAGVEFIMNGANHKMDGASTLFLSMRKCSEYKYKNVAAVETLKSQRRRV